jgi:SAM-dependent methyltransferase
VAASYDAGYYGGGSHKFVGIIEGLLGIVSTARARCILKDWNGGQEPSVLDIGCGRGHLLRAFADLGANVLGLERQEFPEEALASDAVRVGSLDDPEYRDRRFDIVIIWHVLEHLDHHDELLDRITAALNPGGTLHIAVPNFASLQQRWFNRHWFHLDLPRHLVHFEADWLQERLLARGYRIESSSHTDLLQNSYGFIQSAMNALFPARRNRYYALLKSGISIAGLVPLLGWSMLALLLLPAALLDALLGALLGRGATVKIAARREESA